MYRNVHFWPPTPNNWTFNLFLIPSNRDSAYFEDDGSRKGYELENYDSLIKEKYWELLREKHQQETEKQLEENIKKKKRRIIMAAIEAFQAIKEIQRI